jgi:hypothetical protein
VISGVLYATRNEPFYDVDAALAFSNALNTSNVTFHGVWTLLQGQACCRRVSCLTPIDGTEPYVTVQYAIELRGGFHLDDDGYWDGFKLRIINTGTTGFYDADPPGIGPFMQLIGKPDGTNELREVSFPIRLHPNGVPMADGYVVGCPISVNVAGYTSPVGNTGSVPPTQVWESATDAYYLKVIPQGIKLRDLNELNL